MKISPEEVVHVAELARLDVSEGEIESLTRQMNRILEYMDKLNELDTEGVPPTSHVIDLANAFREDTVEESWPRQESLANAPDTDGEVFIVPKVI